MRPMRSTVCARIMGSAQEVSSVSWKRCPLAETITRVPFVDLKAQYAGLREEMNAAVLDVLEETCFIGGPILDRFEQEFAAYVGAKYCIGVANGTDALSLAARAAGVGPGDEVLVPANSFFA